MIGFGLLLALKRTPDSLIESHSQYSLQSAATSPRERRAPTFMLAVSPALLRLNASGKCSSG